MKIEYISHACILIDTGDLRIATDPWLQDPTYCGQWHLFPKPVNGEKIKDVDVILISHGHEDHLHEETLRTFDKDIKIYYPYSFFGGAKEYIESIGFKDVTEAVTLKKYKLSDKTSVTFMINSHDSLMVIENENEVFVNVNDALHSSPEKVIDHYLAEIKRKWKKIDYVFCGFGGASYFPNTMHVKGKDDREISLVREQLFAHNFCRVVKGLKPKIAVPFAADFALLDEEQLWINEARFPRQKMAAYYKKHFAEKGYEPKILDMYSGDILDGFELKPLSPYRKEMKDGEVGHLLEKQYGKEMSERNKVEYLEEEAVEKLVGDLRKNVENRMMLFSQKKLNRLVFTLEMTDFKENNFINISFNNSEAIIERDDKPADDSLLTMQLSSEILKYSIGSDWGADVVSIGYGTEIFISDKRAAEVDLESICMNLLACYPTVSDLKKTPLRTMKFLLLNPPRFTTSIRKLKEYNAESENYDRKTWLLKDAETIRKKYDLPELDEEFLPSNDLN